MGRPGDGEGGGPWRSGAVGASTSAPGVCRAGCDREGGDGWRWGSGFCQVVRAGSLGGGGRSGWERRSDATQANPGWGAVGGRRLASSAGAGQCTGATSSGNADARYAPVADPDSVRVPAGCPKGLSAFDVGSGAGCCGRPPGGNVPSGDSAWSPARDGPCGPGDWGVASGSDRAGVWASACTVVVPSHDTAGGTYAPAGGAVRCGVADVGSSRGSVRGESAGGGFRFGPGNVVRPPAATGTESARGPSSGAVVRGRSPAEEGP